jgi:hypothetical protein
VPTILRTPAFRWSLVALAVGGLAATAAAVWLAVALLQSRSDNNLARAPEAKQPQVRPQVPPFAPQPQPVRPLEVASADEVEILSAEGAYASAVLGRNPLTVAADTEVEILSVKGADTGTIVVGDLPVTGPLILLAHGEVELTSAKPEIHMGGGNPMIWTPLASEKKGDD